MRETDDHPYKDHPDEKESGLRSILSGWALWAAILLGFAIWAGVRSLLPMSGHIVADIDEAARDLPASATAAPTARDSFVLRLRSADDR